MTFAGLLNSRVKVSRLELVTDNGRAQMIYVDQSEPLNYVKVRLDLTFLRPGKDVPLAVEAGKAPDRIGVCFCFPDSGFRAGDRLTAVPNDFGKMPVTGTFDIRSIPDEAQAFSEQHHIEVQVVEVSQKFSDDVRPFPGVEE